jgi:Papain family cysteine protease
MARTRKSKLSKLDARPDTLDFRDLMYTPSLVEVPTRIPLESYKKAEVPILDQGQEGACTGFGLATVANYLLRSRKVVPDKDGCSPRMLYEMAKRYDEWPGEDYSGSSARGAIKGWHKHGVCSATSWPYDPKKPDRLTDARTSDALKRPLGAYYRVNHKDIVAMHSSLAEVGILYATGTVHSGWDDVGKGGIVPYSEKVEGVHAFAIVAYDEHGFWIQNSWGKDWGAQGFGRVSYDDWLENGTDVWVARLGAPVTLRMVQSIATSHSAAAGQSRAYSYADLRPHIVSIGNDGLLKPGGNYGTSAQDVQAIFQSDFPRVTKNWKRKHLLLYAHGGLVGEETAVQRLADYRSPMLEASIYPISFIWHSDYWTTITNILRDAVARKRPEGILDSAKDFMLDRLDDALEPLARAFSGKSAWDEMKENARLATEGAEGGARFTLQCLAALLKEDPHIKVHIVGHSAGALFHAPLVRLLTSRGSVSLDDGKVQTGYGVPVESCTLWAPACITDVFTSLYVPAIESGQVKRCAIFALDDKTERDDDCGGIYNKSLLYLVSGAFEAKPRIPLFRDGVPVLGMEKFIRGDRRIAQLIDKGLIDLILAPNLDPQGSPTASTAKHHGDFDDDLATVKATLARVLQQKKEPAAVEAALSFERSASSVQARRLRIQRQLA